MSVNTNKTILITSGVNGSLSTSVSQIDFKWSNSGIGSNYFKPRANDIRATVYNWVNLHEPVLALGGAGTVDGVQYFVGPYTDYTDSFTGITSAPLINIYPLRGYISARSISVTGLTTLGSLSITGAVYDSGNQVGFAGSILSSTGSGILWIAPSSGTISGSISDRQIAFGNGSNAISGVSTFVYTSAGNVGVGTATPTQTLHVQGNTRITGAVYDSDNSAGSAGNILSSTGSGVAWSSAVQLGFITGSGTLNRLVKFTPTGVQIGDSNVSDNGTTVTINSDLSVTGVSTFIGLGTFNNGLNVRGRLLDANISSGSFGNILSSTVNGVAWSSLSALGLVTNVVGGFAINTASIGTAIIVSVNPATNFTWSGIHTFSQSVYLQSFLYDSNSSAGLSGYLLRSTGTGVAWSSLSSLGLVTGSGSVTQIAYWSNNNQITGSPTFIYTGSGSVGIGTAIPTQVLHIQGSARITGGIYDSNNSVGSSGNILSSTGSGIAWSTVTQLGVITGSGTLNRLAKFTPTGVQIGDSNVSDDGVTVTVSSGLSVVGVSTFVGLGTFNNGLNIRGRLIDANLTGGASGNILSSTGSGIAWSTLVQLGVITGSGTVNFIPKFTPTGVQLGNSNISDSGATVTVGSDLSVTGVSTFIGLGTFNNGLNIRGRLLDANLSSGSSGNILSSTGSGIAWSTSVQLGFVTGTGSATQIAYWSNANQITGSSTFVYTGLGSVGIGTAIPSQSLHVQGGFRLTGAFYDLNNLPGLNNQVLVSTGTGVTWTTQAAGGNVSGSFSSPQIPFANGANSLIGLSTFVFYGIGSVGIGTAIPTQFLHVQGASRLNGGIYDSNNQIGLAGSVLSSTGSGIAWTAAGSGSATIGGSISDRQIAFGNGSNTIAGISTFVYSSLGRVGLGTASPQSSLQVYGDGASLSINPANSTNGVFLQVTDSVTINPTLLLQSTPTQYLELQSPNGQNRILALGADLSIETNASENVVLAPFAGHVVLQPQGAGNIGVKTAIPTQDLHVQGNARITGAVYDTNNITGSSGNILSSTGSGIAWSTLVQLGIITGSGTINRLAKFTPTGVQIGNSNVSDDGTTVTVSSGLSVTGVSTFVGLGTFNNGLNIRGRLLDVNLSPGSSGNILSSTGSGIAWSTSVQLGLVTGTGSATQITYWSNANQITGSSTFIYTGLGSVGIGTAIPTQFLHVQGASRLNGGIYDSNNQIGLAGSVLSSTGSGIAWTAVVVNSATIGGSISDRQIAFGNGSNAIAGISTFIYTSAGNVGIGTVTPTQFLHVQGNARITGGIYDSNNSVGSSGNILSSTGSGIAWSTLVQLGVITGSGTINTLAKFTPTGIQIGNSNVSDDGTTVTVSSGLSVTGVSTFIGLGTFNNGLNIRGRLLDANLSAGSSGNILSSTGSGIAWSTSVQLGLVTGTGSATQITYWSNANQITGSSTFIYTGLGSVGIGTATPTQFLHVQGASRFNGGIYDSNNQIGLAGSVLSSTGSGIAWTAVATSSGTIGGSIADRQIAFGNAANAIAGISTFVYTGIGSVGIGTATPTQFLHVQGASRFNGGIYDSSNSAGTSAQALYSTGSGIAWSTPNINSLTGYPLSIANGGTGESTANAALNALLPTQTGNANKYLQTDGSNTSWQSLVSAAVAGAINESFTGVTSYTVTHNLGAYPIVDVVDENYSQFIPLSVVHNNTNSFTVSFNGISTGTIIASLGSPETPIINVSSTYGISSTTDYTVNCTSNSFTVTLPTAVGIGGKIFVIKNSGTGTITLATTGGQTIDGNSTVDLPTQYMSLTVQSTGTNWIII